MYATAHNTSISLWDSSTNQLVHNFVGPSIGSAHYVRFAGKDGSVLAATGRSGLIAWSLLDFEGVFAFDPRHKLVSHVARCAALLEVDTLLATVFDQLPSEELQVTELIPRPKRKANLHRLLKFDLSATTEAQASLFPAPMRQMKELAVAPQEQSLLLISMKGDLLMTTSSGKTAKPSSVTPSKIELPTTRQSKLFDDIFGPSNTISTAPTPSSARPTSDKSSLLSEVLAPAAHLLPPLSLVWQDLIPLPAKLPIQQTSKSAEQTPDETNDAEDIEMAAPEDATLTPQALPEGLIASILKS